MKFFWFAVLIGLLAGNLYSQQCNLEVVVDGPAGEVKPNQEARFQARVIPATSSGSLSYSWKLSDSNFVITRSRSNNRIIFVKARDPQRANKKRLTAEVTVSGIAQNCNVAKNAALFRDRLILNMPANVNSVDLTTAEIIACPSDPNKNNPPNGKVNLKVYATDPDGDDLIYNFTISGGRLDQSGSTAVWDLSGARPGTYTITVGVDDGEGCDNCGQTVTKIVTVRECSDNPEVMSESDIKTSAFITRYMGFQFLSVWQMPLQY